LILFSACLLASFAFETHISCALQVTGFVRLLLFLAKDDIIFGCMNSDFSYYMQHQISQGLTFQ